MRRDFVDDLRTPPAIPAGGVLIFLILSFQLSSQQICHAGVVLFLVPCVFELSFDELLFSLEQLGFFSAVGDCLFYIEPPRDFYMCADFCLLFFAMGRPP